MTNTSSAKGNPATTSNTPAPVRAALVGALQRSRAAVGAVQFVLQLADERVGVAAREQQEVLVELGHGTVVAEVRASLVAEDLGAELAFPPHVSDDEAERLRDKVRDPGWAAALYILTGPGLAGKEDVWQHVRSVGIDWDAILEGSFYLSGGEERMLRIAASCFSSAYSVSVGVALAGLSDEWRERALSAMRLAAGS